MSQYRKLSQEEINDASNTNLINFLSSRGQKTTKRGRTHFWTGGGNDSLSILPDKPHMYKHFSTGDTGNAIHFCQNYLGMGFQDAVEALLGVKTFNDSDYTPPTPSAPQSSERQPFVLPEKDKRSHTRMFQYLEEERGVSKSIIAEFLSTDSLYQTKEQSLVTGKEYSNIAFIAKDFDGNPQGAIKRSFSKNGFKGNHENSNMQDYCFRHDGDGENGRLFIFEAPIDMLSFITFMECKEISERQFNGQSIDDAKQESNRWKKDSHLALGGRSNYSPVLKFLAHRTSLGQDISNIWLALDNDRRGIEANIGMVTRLRDAGYEGKISCYLPKGKDWNEDLQKAVTHRDWQNGSLSQDFINKHIQTKVYPGDIKVLEGILQNYTPQTQKPTL